MTYNGLIWLWVVISLAASDACPTKRCGKQRK